MTYGDNLTGGVINWITAGLTNWITAGLTIPIGHN
jgi:hypothetical protein